MKMKNDCQSDHIKEAFDKLYNCVMPYIDLTQFADADTAFKELDKKVHSEIYILKKKLNNERKHGEDLADVNCRLSSENVDLKARLTLFENSRITWRSRAQHAEKEVEDLNKKISELEEELAQARNSTEPHLMEENDRLREIVNTLEKEINDLKKKIQHLEIENANLRVTPADANAIEVLKRENRVLRCDNKKLAAACEDNKRLREVIDTLEKETNTLKKNIHELEEENISKCPWHGDVNAMTDERTCHKSLVETIEELNAKKARLEENVDLSPGHEFEFGDEVFVPWSDAPYMYVKTGLLYNTRTKRLVYVGKDQHLKWFGEKFAIV